MRRLLFLMVLVALVVPSTASATRHQKIQPAPKAYTNWVPYFEQAAKDYWGNGANPECGEPKFLWIASLDPYHEPINGGHAAADANIDPRSPDWCQIRFDKSYWVDVALKDPGAMGVTIFHEMGHLYGHMHDNDPVKPDPDPLMRWNASVDWTQYPVVRKILVNHDWWGRDFNLHTSIQPRFASPAAIVLN